MIDWSKGTREDHLQASAVVDRVLADVGGDKCSRVMDLIACHTHGCPLDFAGLLEASISDVLHDVSGIAQHLDRETGELQDCFCPRYAVRA